MNKQCKHKFEIADKQAHTLLEAQTVVGTRLAVYVLCVECGLVKLYYIHETRQSITGAK